MTASDVDAARCAWISLIGNRRSRRGPKDSAVRRPNAI